MSRPARDTLALLLVMVAASCSNPTTPNSLPNIVANSQANHAPQQPVPQDDSYGPDVSTNADSSSDDSGTGAGGAPSGDCMYASHRSGYRTSLCGGSGGGGGGSTLPGYNPVLEDRCNAAGGDYLSLQNGSVQCTTAGTVTVNKPFNCPFSVVLNPPTLGIATFSIVNSGPPIAVNHGTIVGGGGIRVGYDCEVDVI